MQFSLKSLLLAVLFCAIAAMLVRLQSILGVLIVTLILSCLSTRTCLVFAGQLGDTEHFIGFALCIVFATAWALIAAVTGALTLFGILLLLIY